MYAILIILAIAIVLAFKANQSVNERVDKYMQNSNSYNLAPDKLEEIKDNSDEEKTTAKYNFDVCITAATGGGKHGKEYRVNTVFSTKIKIQNYKLNYKSIREYEKRYFKNLEKKYNSFTEGEQEINLDDILSVQYKMGFARTSHYFEFIVILLIIILGIYYPISEIFPWKTITYDYTLSVLMLLGVIVCISYFTCKCIEIKYKSDEGIKKIIFPISRVFFFSTPKSVKKQVDTLLEEVREKTTHNIKIKKDRLKWIIIIYIIINCILSFGGPIYRKQKNLLDNDLSYNINHNLVYCDVAFDKGKIVDIINEREVSKYILELTNGEKIKIEGVNLDYGKTYNICIQNYYKKNTNKLLKTKYVVNNYAVNNSNIMRVWADNAEYVYDYIGNKLFKLNFLNNDNIVDFGTQIYYRDVENTNTLYNFINNDKNILVITEDFDVKELKQNNYETIEKIDTYISEYGQCHILKANYNEKIDYLMYIENNDKNVFNELDGILLNSNMDRTESFKNDETAIKSFKIICPEIR